MSKTTTVWVWIGLFGGLLSLVACDPIDSCDPDQYFVAGACRVCPAESKSTGRSCKCDDPAKEFTRFTCRYRKGEEPPQVDAGAMVDASMSSDDLAETCGAYCGFLKVCIADNPAVAGAIDSVITAFGIEGDDATSCSAMCNEDGAEAANSAALECLTQQAQSATCAGNPTLDAVGEALTIIDNCCSMNASSSVCARLCTAVAMHPLVLENVPTCQ